MTILKTLLVWVLEWGAGKLASLFQKMWKQKKSDDALDEKAKQAAKAMKDAKTQDELDQADRDVLGG